MRQRLIGFVQVLRQHGIEVSPAETLDAVAAVAAVGVEREAMREALAATLVKDERERARFDPLFDVAFPLVGGRRVTSRARRGRSPSGVPEEGAGGTAGRGGSASSGRPERPPDGVARAAGARPGGTPRSERPADRAQEATAPERPRPPAAPEPEGEPAARDRIDHLATALRAAVPTLAGTGSAPAVASRRARHAGLLVLPFAQMSARDVAEARELVAELGARLRGRLARRERRARRGRVDLRRTLRAATTTGGVPLRLRHRARRPGRPDLVALCDLSGSVAAASELLLGLLAPAGDWFRRVHSFAFVDRLCPVSIEQGHVAPEGALDLYARSDFGRVLADLWPGHASVLGPGTLLLVLGDARNNRRPPRLDLWREVCARVARIVWLVPEPRARWNTGDSVLGLYAPGCDAVLECLDLATLVSAVRRSL